jgi:hypothetical protein
MQKIRSLNRRCLCSEKQVLPDFHHIRHALTAITTAMLSFNNKGNRPEKACPSPLLKRRLNRVEVGICGAFNPHL